MDLNEKIKKARDMILESKYSVALSGAGISTPSGIPDFRSPESGLWNKIDPMEVATIWAFKSNPRKFYEFMYPISRNILGAKPNPAHNALAKLEEKELLQLVITQNIDSLHQRAGNKKVVELHGNLREIICIKCRSVSPLEVLKEEIEKKISEDKNYYPKCSCGGLLKPNVILFGETLPSEALYRAQQSCSICELMIVVGSSLTVQPANFLPVVAHQKGARIIIVNLQETPLDETADLVIREKLEKVLPEIVEGI